MAPRTKGFREGWAVPLGLRTAHYFERREAGLVDSVCGVWRGGPAGLLFDGAEWDRKCKRCQKKRAA